jgi:anaerobic magnesium-protoporphyrin IX monomethyl ester cyclase
MSERPCSILLCGPDREENLPIRYLASALTAAGHRAELASFDTGEYVERVVEQAAGFDAVGLSIAYQVRAQEFLALARALKARWPELPIVAGGHYASCAAEALLEHHPEIDLVVVHEGERAIVELVDARFAPGALPGIAGLVHRARGRVTRTPPRPMVEDLDSLAWPDRRGRARLLAGVPTAYMMGSRGCVFSCDYCCITTLHRMAPGKKLRQRDPSAIADEMAALYHERGVRQFVFHDDNFLLPNQRANHRRLEAFERAWAERGLSGIGFTIKCRPGDAQRPILGRLQSMGLLRLFLGIESSTETGLRAIGRRQPVEAALHALDCCDELGLSVQYSLMLFNPESTLASVEQDLDFMQGHLHHAFNFCRTEIYAGTPLEARMIEQGRAQGGYLARTYRFSDPQAGLMSELALRLLHDRCWTMDSLMERTVGIDHLSAVLRHYYEPTPELEALRADIHAWRLSVNQHLVDLLRQIAAAVRGARGADDPALIGLLAELRRSEAHDRQRLLAEGHRVGCALQSYVSGCIGLAAPSDGKDAAAGSRKAKLCRHAAAVVLSLGVAACGGRGVPQPDRGVDHGVYEAPPPPLDHRVTPSDARAEHPKDLPRLDRSPKDQQIIDWGVYEAPPPPLDAGKK